MLRAIPRNPGTQDDIQEMQQVRQEDTGRYQVHLHQGKIQGEYRPLSPKSKWYVPKEAFLTVIHYCKQYPEWEAELAAMTDTSKGIAYDADRVQSSGDSDPTADLAIRRAAISRKKDMVDHVAYKIGGEPFSKWLILGICHDYPFYYLQSHGIPCGKDLYYEMRRRFIYEMAKKI